MKCVLCGKGIEETFLNKFEGTYVRVKEKDKSRMVALCRECQSKHGNKLKEKLKNAPR